VKILVKLKWHGHACFEITNEVTVVFDPHDGSSLGLPRPEVKADLVLLSHGHFDHAGGVNFVSKPDSVIIDKPGVYDVKGVKVKGIPTFHDKSRGLRRGSNTVFVVDFEGIRFVHLGDLGHILSEGQVEDIDGVDVLFVPVGGVYTIDAGEATEIVGLLKPKIAIPMHYAVPGLSLPIASVEDFVRNKVGVRRFASSEVEITREFLPSETEIWVLAPPSR